MSTLSNVTSGAAASKKFSVCPSPIFSAMAAASASLVKGPEAMMTFPLGMAVTSPGTTVILGCERIFSVTSFEKP